MPKKRKGLVLSVWESVLAYLKLPFTDLITVWDYMRSPAKRRYAARKVWEFISIFYRRVTTEGVLKESASLTYITLLGFIPFITFVVLMVPNLPFLDFKAKLNTVIEQNFVPGSARAVTQFISGLLKQRTGFNIFSFIVLIVSSYSLFSVIRDTFDRILSMQIRPPVDWLGQLLKFLGTMIFGMFIMIVLFSTSSMPIISTLLRYSFLKQQLLYLIPFVIQFMALTFLYMILPSIRVQRSSLFRGAFWTTVVWVIAKSGFDWYIFNLTSVQKVYGYFALLPISLMWIYANWVIIIGGIVLISVIDQKDKVEIARKIPKKVVRITMEMYSDGKLNQRLEDYLSRSSLNNMVKIIEEEGEK